MMFVVLYIILSFIKVLIKNLKTIFLAKENKIMAPAMAGMNAVLTANLIKLVVEFNVLTASLIAFSINVVGTYFSIIISKYLKNMKKKKLTLTWFETENKDTVRRGAMYCYPYRNDFN